MSEVQGKTNPLFAIAAVSVIIFSAVGVGVMTGVIPSSKSTVPAVQAPAATVSAAPEIKPAPAPEVRVVEAPPARVEPAPEPKVVEAPRAIPAKPAPRPATVYKAPPVQVATAEPPRVATNEPPRPPIATNAPPPVIAANEPVRPAPPPVPQICANCGVINAINVVEQKGQGSGVGVVAGGVVGGLVGHQIGQGRGNTAATVVGAVGGALAGNEVEKRVKATKQYNVSVRMDDGNFRNFTLDVDPGMAIGEKVKVIDGRLVRG